MSSRRRTFYLTANDCHEVPCFAKTTYFHICNLIGKSPPRQLKNTDCRGSHFQVYDITSNFNNHSTFTLKVVHSILAFQFILFPTGLHSGASRTEKRNNELDFQISYSPVSTTTYLAPTCSGFSCYLTTPFAYRKRTRNSEDLLQNGKLKNCAEEERFRIQEWH